MNILCVMVTLAAFGLTPTPQQMDGRRGFFYVQPNTPVVLPDQPGALDESQVQDLLDAVGYSLPILHASQYQGGPAIVIGVLRWHGTFDKLRFHRRAKAAERLQAGGYSLRIWRRGVVVAGADPAGAFYGLRTLVQIAQAKGLAWPCLDIMDWPDLPIRAAYAESLLDADQLKQLAVFRCNWVIFDCAELCDLKGVRGLAWKKAFENARRFNLEPVPMLHLLEGADALLRIEPKAVEGRTATDRITLAGETPAALSHSNVIFTETCPVRVQISGLTCRPGVDYLLEAGRLEAPFYEVNGPWRLRRLPGGDIPDGAIATVTYSYAPPGSSALCPYAPETKQLLEDVLGEMISRLTPRYIHLGLDTVARLNQDQRSLAQKKSNTAVFWDAVALVSSLAKAKNPDIQMTLWADAINPRLRAGEYGLDGAADAAPKDILVIPRFTDATGTRLSYLDETLGWCAGLGVPYLAAAEGGPATAFAVAAGATRGGARGFCFSGSTAGDAFQTGMARAWTAHTPAYAWAVGLNDFFNTCLWTPSDEERMNTLAGHLDRAILEGRTPQEVYADFRLAADHMRTSLSVGDPELGRVDGLFRRLTRYLELESEFHATQAAELLAQLAALVREHASADPSTIGSRQENLLTAIERDKRFVSADEIFGVPLSAYRAMTLPVGQRLYEVPVSPAYTEDGNRAEAVVDLRGHVGGVYRLDFDAAPAARLTLERGVDGENYATAEEWRAEDAGGARSSVTLKEPLVARRIRLSIETPGASPRLKGLRLFALKGPAEVKCNYVVEPPRLANLAASGNAPEASTAIGFLNTTTPRFAEAPTELRISRSRTHLFFAVFAWEAGQSSGTARMTGRDMPLWQEESVEIILEVDKSGPYRLIVNPLGAQYDSHAGDAGWDGDWQVSARHEDAGWAALVSVPFATLGVTPVRAEQWRINFRRMRSDVTQESSAWAHDYDSMHLLQYGTLAFE